MSLKKDLVNREHVEVQIDNYDDRENVVMALVNAGYSVKVEERQVGKWPSEKEQYWVIADRTTRKEEDD